MKIAKLLIIGLVIGQCTSVFANSELSVASGTFIVAAPTALNGPTNEGIWFVKNGSFSLHLPDLGPNQVYEGWVVDNCTGKKVSTGIFRADGKTDSDGAGPFAGPLALNYPPVPGSDFVKIGSNIVDGAHVVVITVEPYPDTDSNPSGVVVLRAEIPANAAVGTEVTLQNTP